MASQWNVEVIEVAEIRLVGMRVHTSMTKAMQDCPKLWEQTFIPRLPDITGIPLTHTFQTETYGLSVMTGEDTFDYWATTALPEGVAVPEGMLTTTLPGGLYACCRVNAMEQLSDAYTLLYMTWPQEQNDYAPNMQAPCFERYGKEYLESGSFTICMPLVRR